MLSHALILLYQVAGTIFFVLALPYVILRAARRPSEMRERLGWGRRSLRTREGPLWVHAASLGELRAVAGLGAGAVGGAAGNVAVKTAEGGGEHPFASGRSFALPILVTVLSVSARPQAAGAAPRGSVVSFAPLDLWLALIPFVLRHRPRGLLLFETELWPFTLWLLRRFGIPVAVVSGRLSQRRWPRTRRLRPLLRDLLRGVDLVAAQGKGDAERFVFLGAKRVEVAGNLKYRPVTPPAELPGFSAFVFVAGSLRLGEECVLDAVRDLLAESDEALAVVAPRHLREKEHWTRSLRERGLDARARTQILLDGASEDRGATELIRDLRRALGEARVLLVDTHGELSRWYGAGAAAFVGGTLAPIGGHSLFEPAACGVPVAFGPFTAGVQDVAEPLLRHGGGTRVRDGRDLSGWLLELCRNQPARVLASQGAWRAAIEVGGAAERTWRLLETLPWTRVEGRG